MNDETGYSERYCVFVDILGFKQLLHGLSAPKIQRLLTKVYNPVDPKKTIEEEDYRVQSISDALAMSAAPTKEGLGNLVFALDELSLDLLREAHFVRGALVKGGLFHNDNMAFGPTRC